MTSAARDRTSEREEKCFDSRLMSAKPTFRQLRLDKH
jgi:hypothetical protein